MGDVTKLIKRIIIVGAGGFGREMLSWLLDSKEEYKDWDVIGFIDDDRDALKGYKYNLPILSSIQDFHPEPGVFLLMSLGVPKTKETVSEFLEMRGAEFISFIHRTAIVGTNVAMGRGCVLCPNSILTCDVTLGDFVTVNCFSGAGHDVSIGSFSTLSAHVDITGFAKIGERVFFGSHATVLPKVQIEDNAVIGAGSVVIRNVKKDTTVFGNPAKVVFTKETV